MYDSELLRKELSRDEGRRNRVYRDNKRTAAHPDGYLTVGVGWNLDVNGIPPEVKVLLPDGDPYSPEFIWPEPAIDKLLDIGIEKVAVPVLDALVPHWRTLLDDMRQRVLLNMAFNMGKGDQTHGLSSFHHFLEAVNRGDWEMAALEMEPLRSPGWHKDVGVRAERLTAMMKPTLNTTV